LFVGKWQRDPPGFAVGHSRKASRGGLTAGLQISVEIRDPGASYRGLHDSLVNYPGNKCPPILLCLHEE
jgi:hypothetical protein